MLTRRAMILTSALAGVAATSKAAAPGSAQLTDWLVANRRSPERYVVDAFTRHDVVLLGEDHCIRHNLLFVQGLIPHLHAAGVNAIGMEFGATEDQDALDRLVTGARYDEAEARRLMFSYNSGWAFKEYHDVYRAAWAFNRTLPAGAPRFRILNLSYVFDWSAMGAVRTPGRMARVFHRGNPETFRVDLIEREILDRGEKLLVLTGTIHALTRFAQPCYDYQSPGYVRLEANAMGHILHRRAPGRIFSIITHQAFASSEDGAARMVRPAGGAIDQALAKMTDQRVGFDLPGTPFGDLPETSAYSWGHPDLRLAQLADGYIYERPFDRFEGCTIDEAFLTPENWPEARRQYPDPDWRRPPETLAEYRQIIRDFADIPKRYRAL